MLIELGALAMVVGAGLYLVSLGTVSLLAPSLAGRFLLGFATTPAKHYTELAVRLLIGGSFVLRARAMLLPDFFSLFGWVLLATTAGLLLIPWRWHHRFAQRVAPEVLRFLPLVGLASMVLGAFVLFALFCNHGD